MKPINSTLQTYLASNRQFVFCDVITIYLVGGTGESYKVRLTTGQQAVTVLPLDGDSTYRTFSPGICNVSGLKAKQSRDLTVDEQSMTLTPFPGALVLGMDFKQAAIAGVFDGAQVRRDRFYFSAWGTATLGGIPMFNGYVSTLDSIGRTNIVMKVKSGPNVLNLQMPKHVAAPTCQNTFCDTACGLSLSAFSSAGTVGSGATTTYIPWTGGSANFTMGKVYFGSLGTAAIWRSIKSATTSGLTLAYPLPVVPPASTAFTAYQGCLRTQAACSGHGNTARFRGFRFVPSAELAY